MLIRLICTVRFTIATPLSINAHSFVTLELRGGADGAVVLITVIVTFREAIATPGHRNAVNLACGASELLRGASGWLCERKKM